MAHSVLGGPRRRLHLLCKTFRLFEYLPFGFGTFLSCNTLILLFPSYTFLLYTISVLFFLLCIPWLYFIYDSFGFTVVYYFISFLFPFFFGSSPIFNILECPCAVYVYSYELFCPTLI